MKNVEFCVKTSFEFCVKTSIYPKDVCSFAVFFLNSKTPEILPLVTLVTNYHKFWSDPDENLKNKNWC